MENSLLIASVLGVFATLVTMFFKNKSVKKDIQKKALEYDLSKIENKVKGRSLADTLLYLNKRYRK